MEGSYWPQGGKVSGMNFISKLNLLETKFDVFFEMIYQTSISELQKGSNFRWNAFYLVFEQNEKNVAIELN